MVRQAQSPRPVAVRMAAPFRARKSLAPIESELPVEEFNKAYFDKALESQEGIVGLYNSVDKCIRDRDRHYVRAE
jgi:hypothetical protein